MFTEFATIQFSREELKELQQALLQRAMLEDELRREHGLEKADKHPLLEKIEALLGESQEKMQVADQASEDEMWEFAWYAFTDEWAWFRAGQETEASKPNAGLSASERKTAVEKLYHDDFDRYVAEIDMLDQAMKEKVENRKPDHKKASR